MNAPRLLPCGPAAWLVELDDPDEVLSVAAAAGARRDVVEVVPGARTVLVRLAAGADLDEVARHLSRRPAIRTPVAEPSDREVVLPVVYDGADLEAVADACRLSVDDVVRRHAGSTYRSAFCGFSPGFSYLRGLDPALRLPRRATPRSKVPAGAVAIAAGYTAVYPTSSPGGWQVLGRTDTVLFDPALDPPALLAPGTTVRFEVRQA
ncbi:MAG: 5-oxoprolinase subunit B family protein [Ilumatobacteraceae bacterium]